MKTEHAGNGYATTGPGITSYMRCQVCEEEMEIKRNFDGATGMAEAMSRRKHLHDVFTCKDRHEDWHLQAFEIQREASKTHSGKLKKMLLNEVDEIIKTRKVSV